MKIFITTAGDRSVGIQPAHLHVDLGNCVGLSKPEYREEVRTMLRTTFEELLDEPCDVRFEDEREDVF